MIELLTVLSFSEKTREHQTEIGVLLWVRLTKLKKAKTMKGIMALQVCDWAAHCATIDYYTALPAGFLDSVSALLIRYQESRHL